MNPKLGVRAFFGIALALFMTMPAINLSEPLMRERALKMIKEWDGSGLVKLAFQGDKLESWLSAFLWQTGISINPDQVLIGYDGWLHLGDENSRTISVTRGAATKWREKRSKEIARSLLNWDRWLQAQGVQSMTFMLSPDKATVYRETLPHWVRTSTGDTIASVGRDASPLVLDLRHALQAIASTSEHQLYYKTDTHWNSLGAAHAFALLGERLQGMDPALHWPIEAPIVVENKRNISGGDLSNLLRISNEIKDTAIRVRIEHSGRFTTNVTDFETKEVLLKNTLAAIDFPHKTVHTHTPQALNSRRVLWMRDSFGIALTPMMAATFEETVQVHWRRGMTENARIFQQLVKEWKPDLVVFTVVERDVLATQLLAAPRAID